MEQAESIWASVRPTDCRPSSYQLPLESRKYDTFYHTFNGLMAGLPNWLLWYTAIQSRWTQNPSQSGSIRRHGSDGN